ncbi:MAG: ATP-binding protein [Bacteroidetes bacterium]|nr:ATP-binding protein [Bacteroidota bacterium]
MNSIKYDDFSHTYATQTTGTPSTDRLNKELNQVIKKFREVRAEKEAQYHYMKTIVQHVGIGIITFDKKGDIQIINTAAKKLLKVNQVKNINSLESISDPLVQTFYKLKTGGRDLVKIERLGDEVQLAVYAIELTLRGDDFKLVSLQNIRNELEEKEMEAWQNLIQVLTHEIMNSVTPISSLAATVEEELGQHINDKKKHNGFNAEDIEDLHLAVQTIHRRSLGLIRFVSDFRNLTRIPTPKREPHKVKEIFDQIVMLLKTEIKKGRIKINMDITPQSLTINVDKELMEQVLINLIKNAIQALCAEDDGKDKIIDLRAQQNEKNETTISIKDNGPGIDDEALSKIFIPFFTTKKHGSGIGLSLSKQIIRKHNGTLTVKSFIDQGAEFTIKL